MDILNLLRRYDKWYLGGGNKLAWTPTFPLFLNYPGFWDFASYYNQRIEPCFTVTFLDKDGNPYELNFLNRTWIPAFLEQEYSCGSLEFTERKMVLPNDTLVSEVEIFNNSEEDIELNSVMWAAQNSDLLKEGKVVENIKFSEGLISFNQKVERRVRPKLSYKLAVSIGVNDVKSYNVNFTERTVNYPNWYLTPFYENFENGSLKNEIKTEGITKEGMFYMALHSQHTIKANQRIKIVYVMGIENSRKVATKQVKESLQLFDPERYSLNNWKDYFSSLPFFETSNEYFNRYYWYRWYGLRLLKIDAKEGNYHYSAIAEGIDYFRVFITYSAQCHIFETKWMKDSSIARGSLLNFLENQKEDGCFIGHIYVKGIDKRSFYHANWGSALKQFLMIHEDKEYISKIYPKLKKYVEYFDRERDKENSGLYDVIDQFETGQEFMSRYMVIDKKADIPDWSNKIRMKGVDSTTYIYELKKTMAYLAKKLGKKKDMEMWKASFIKTKEAMLKYMWNEKEEMFFDLDNRNFSQTHIKAATCFYPYFTDIVNEKHLNGLKKHLLNPKEFWTPYPVTSSSVDDDYFNAYAEWKGKRHSCPWNGRVWPMTNSHIVEGLGISARRFKDPVLEEKTVEMLEKFVKMMFYNSDPERPNCFEHYNPYSGKECIYRGIDDYQHSWINDLIFKYIVGVDITEDKVFIDPFPSGLKDYRCKVFIRGHELEIIYQEGEEYLIKVDSQIKFSSVKRKKFILDI